ncbi:Horcolin [Podospora fimiseda]|uniref:Horcolin n=1 Tax=Podospora fimiseda TaxID=252190 RepID=A0AAN7GVK9_9PEZI|nr:Horcolin [Podospora fimiseda]
MRFTTPLSAAALLLLNNSGVLAQTSSGVFNVLAMNVAGLPAFLNGNDVPGDKTVNAETIGAKLSANKIDVAHLQEDFNYHAAIYKTNTHPHRTPTSGGVPFGSGLNTVSNFPWVDFRRIKWSKCSDASQSDCLTPKGFTFMRISIAPGVYADFYNLHADAGVEPGDLDARNSNINQVADYINTWSKGNAVIVYGDFNSRYTRTGDTAIRGLLNNGLNDAWLEAFFRNTVPSQPSCGNPAADNLCEVVDKVFYRAGPLLNLQAESFNYDGARFLQPNGNILTDHNPVFVNFTWSASTKLRQSVLSGGTGGTGWFNDATTLANIAKPKASTLTFSGGSRLDSVSIRLTDGTTTFKHGGNGGTASTLSLAANEYWTEAELCRGVRNSSTRNFYIQAVTSTGRTVAAGTATNDCSKFAAPSGWQIVGFLGQSGDEVDQLGFIYAPR